MFYAMESVDSSYFTWQRNSVSLVYCYWLFSFVTHDCESHDVWLSHMTHNYDSWLFTHVIHFGHMTSFISYDWFKYVAQLTHTSHLMDFTLWFILSHELQDTEYESRLREKPLYKGTLRIWVWVLHATIYFLSYTILSIRYLYLLILRGKRRVHLLKSSAINAA